MSEKPDLNEAREALLRAQSATAGSKAILPVAIKTIADLRVHTEAFVAMLREYVGELESGE